jgi:hypothetical protein
MKDDPISPHMIEAAEIEVFEDAAAVVGDSTPLVPGPAPSMRTILRTEMMAVLDVMNCEIIDRDEARAGREARATLEKVRADLNIWRMACVLNATSTEREAGVRAVLESLDAILGVGDEPHG